MALELRVKVIISYYFYINHCDNDDVDIFEDFISSTCCNTFTRVHLYPKLSKKETTDNSEIKHFKLYNYSIN